MLVLILFLLFVLIVLEYNCCYYTTSTTSTTVATITTATSTCFVFSYQMTPPNPQIMVFTPSPFGYTHLISQTLQYSEYSSHVETHSSKENTHLLWANKMMAKRVIVAHYSGMVPSEMQWPSINERQQYIGLYCKNTRYCNYNSTALNTTILHIPIDLVHIYLVCEHLIVITHLDVSGEGGFRVPGSGPRRAAL